ncbi:MAG: hypothetical protein K6G88_13580 [Lachnospiraceae bacterium]|nr:hypothetical protein [Lachnospiraceae bacterium]
MTKKLQKYKYLIFDVDDTLLDFGKAFFTAQKNVAALLEVDYSDEFQKTDEKTGRNDQMRLCAERIYGMPGRGHYRTQFSGQGSETGIMIVLRIH